MFGLTKLDLTKSRALSLGVAGVALSAAIIAIATQAKAQFRAQNAQPVAPADAPDSFNLPNQIGAPGVPSTITPRTPDRAGTRTPDHAGTRTPDRPGIRTPDRPGTKTRRVPIEPVPMPGDRPTPLAPIPAPRDIRTIPGTPPSPISGISGKVSLTPICSVTAPSASCRVRPYTGPLKVTAIDRSYVFRLNTDPEGVFQVRLVPGMYVVEPDSPNFPIGTSQTITVIPNVMRQSEFNFQGTIVPANTGVTLPPLPGANLRPGVSLQDANLPPGAAPR